MIWAVPLLFPKFASILFLHQQQLDEDSSGSSGGAEVVCVRPGEGSPIFSPVPGSRGSEIWLLAMIGDDTGVR